MFEMDKSCERLLPTEDELNNLLATSSKSEPALEEYQSETTNTYYGFEDCCDDDEVFEEFDETRKCASTKTLMVREPRTRRISDVIDSLGDLSPSPSTRHLSFDFPDKSMYGQIEEKNVVVVRREETKHFHLSKCLDPGGCLAVPDSVATSCYMSPPVTPLSDLGYGGSTGMPTPPPPSALVYRPKWFRFSSSSVDACSPPKWSGDTMDAKPLAGAETTAATQQIQTTVSATETSYVAGANWCPESGMPVSKDSPEYNMDHPHRGYAIIFNHEEFTKNNMPSRKGSQFDAISLETTFTSLGFNVQVYNDLDCDKIKSKIIELASTDHSTCDAVVVIVLSHGMGSSYILSHDYPYPVDMLWTPFTPDRCPSLAGKPKLFFIQACRGEKLDGGVRLINQTQTDNASNTYKIPTMADFLIAYSTAEGFYSWRNPQTGTWFIQSLCEVLNEEGTKLDLSALLLKVSRKVALDYESFNDLCPWQHQQKQVPQIISTLIRHCYFKLKQ